MSRFYDALREAGHFRPDVAAAAEQPSLEPVIQGASVTPISNHSTAAAPSTPKAAPDDNPTVNLSDGKASRSVNMPEVALKPIPLKGGLKQKALIANATDPSIIERYRRLRTKIIQLHARQHFRSLIVTSPNPEEGKTVTVVNLALSFSMLPSFKVLIVDGDLRRATLGKWLGAGDRPGFSNLIEGSAELSDVIFTPDAIPISFMGSGTSKMPAAELLQSPNLKSHIQKLTEQFALVLVDSPPANLITDTQLLAASCDAVLLVTRAFVTTRNALEQAVQDLQQFRIIGTILNGGTRLQSKHRYQGYY